MKNLHRIRDHSNRQHKHPAKPWVPDCQPGDKASANGKLTVTVRRVNAQTGQMTDTDGRIHGPGEWRPLPTVDDLKRHNSHLKRFASEKKNP